MNRRRILIRFQPRIYKDLFERLLETLYPVDIVKDASSVASPSNEPVDIVILSLNDTGEVDPQLIPNRSEGAKLVAFSPKGDRGLRRQPGEQAWEEISPYGFEQLMQEVGGAT